MAKKKDDFSEYVTLFYDWNDADYQSILCVGDVVNMGIKSDHMEPVRIKRFKPSKNGYSVIIEFERIRK